LCFGVRRARRWLKRRLLAAEARRVAADENDRDEMRVICEQMAALSLPVSEGGALLQPGLDLDASAGLLEVMESDDASR
jgi:hypothetical protein